MFLRLRISSSFPCPPLEAFIRRLLELREGFSGDPRSHARFETSAIVHSDLPQCLDRERELGLGAPSSHYDNVRSAPVPLIRPVFLPAVGARYPHAALRVAVVGHGVPSLSGPSASRAMQHSSQNSAGLS